MKLGLLALTLIVVCLTGTAVFAGDASDQLLKLFDDEWEFRLQEAPLFATRFGDRRFNDKLGRVTVKARLAQTIVQERDP